MEVPHEQQPTGASANACANACTDDTYSSKSEGAEIAAHNPTHRLHQTADIAPELQRVIEVWPSLPTTIQRGIMAMVEEMRKE